MSVGRPVETDVQSEIRRHQLHSESSICLRRVPILMSVPMLRIYDDKGSCVSISREKYLCHCLYGNIWIHTALCPTPRNCELSRSVDFLPRHFSGYNYKGTSPLRRRKTLLGYKTVPIELTDGRLALCTLSADLRFLRPWIPRLLRIFLMFITTKMSTPDYFPAGNIFVFEMEQDRLGVRAVYWLTMSTIKGSCLPAGIFLILYFREISLDVMLWICLNIGYGVLNCVLKALGLSHVGRVAPSFGASDPTSSAWELPRMGGLPDHPSVNFASMAFAKIEPAALLSPDMCLNTL